MSDSTVMEWYPTPSYLVKRQAILDALAAIPHRSVLEVGCGMGDLMAVLAKRGYTGMGIDLSEEAVAAARLRVDSPSIVIERSDLKTIGQRYRIVIASEVMEHCPDDLGFLNELRQRLTADGYLVLTVPAHRDKWGANDELCGHLRRYERDELRGKLTEAGFDPRYIYSYGVPIYNLMKPLYDRAVSRQHVGSAEQVELTKMSSGMRLLPHLKHLFAACFNDVSMAPFYLLQRLFYTSDLGNGYLAVAQPKPVPGATRP